MGMRLVSFRLFNDLLGILAQECAPKPNTYNHPNSASMHLHRRKDTSLASQAEILLRSNREPGILIQIAQALNRELDLDRSLDAPLAQVALE